MRLSGSEIVLEYVCPALGVIAANVMFAAPLRDCYKAVTSGNGLQELNPLPWAFMLGNTFGWVTYAMLINNLFVFFGNAPGFLFAIYLNLQAVKMQYETFRTNEMRKSIITALNDHSYNIDDDNNNDNDDDMEAQEERSKVSKLIDYTQIVSSVTAKKLHAPGGQDLLIFFNVIVWMIVVCIVNFADDSILSQDTKEMIVGIIVNLNLVVFYGSPLSTIYTVLSTRSAATIHIPTMLTNTFNGTFWAAYGIAILNPFIAVPNSLGAILGVIQIILCIVFYKSTNKNKESNIVQSSKNNKADIVLVVEEEPTRDEDSSSNNKNIETSSRY